YRCFICLATVGGCWQIPMPGTLVLIGLKSPAFVASGLRSHVSIWLGPTLIHSTIRLLFCFLRARAAARKRCTKAMPGKAIAEKLIMCLRKCRRLNLG